MTAASTVNVYNFRLLHRGLEAAPVSSFKATRRVIIEVFGGDPIESTAEEVDLTELDAQGCYRRLTTGWGVLD